VFVKGDLVSEVEEWSLTGLERRHRYESRLAVQPLLELRAFTIDASQGKLYVAYENAPILEIIDLCEPGECVSPE
jgi:hypothetical protein